MRLSLILAKWPKIRPNGNIWIGKHKMVLKVSDRRKGALLEDLEREKENMFYCLHPAVSKGEEKALYEKLAEDTPDPSKQWFKMRKYQVENSSMAPRPLSEHYNSLNKDLKW